MSDDEVIEKTRQFIEDKFKDESTGHDYWHMHRVWKSAQHINRLETNADRLIVELGALLHDIADWKFHDGDEEAGPKAAREWLESIDVDNEVIEQIEEIIRTVSFKGAGVPSQMTTLEGKIIHDADKLDAIGAIGIARTFAYGGSERRSMYEPDVKPEMHQDFESYRTSRGHTINHFYEKLLLLKDLMHTQAAKDIAERRHRFMEFYLDQFYAEWDGER